ncbi:MAG: FAD-dependent oxidoreductase [Pirellulaceae bacterium]|nr:FAD-dependent oxidoreductase [Pirellulaceae bacterium]
MKKGKGLIIGGGFVGLSVAYELLHRGYEITVIDDGAKRNASWASAGVLLPTSSKASHPIDQLCYLGTQIHREWAERLLNEAGIDNELRFSGGLYVARTIGEAAALVGQEEHWSDEEIPFQVVSQSDLKKKFPTVKAGSIRRATWVPDEGQLRSPRHLQALAAAIQNFPCGKIVSGADCQLVTATQKLIGARIDNETITADFVCVCAGAWSGGLVSNLGVHLPTTPVRGQMLLYRMSESLGDFVINEGTRYLVPRSDGHLLAGSTMEEVGFDKGTTPQGINELREFAESLLPCLEQAELVEAWSGLRPASFDGLPYLGRLPGFENGLIATGLFRIGVQVSPAAAKLIADLITGEQPSLDLAPFRPSRVIENAS